MINPNMTALGKSSSAIRVLAAYGARRKQEIGAERVCDYSLGNPNVPCPQVITDCMLRLLEEETPAALHAYTASAGSMEARAAVAGYVNRTYGLAAEAGDVYMTAGAAASLTITLRAVSAAGEEVIVFTPYFPEYKVFIENGGAAVREVPVRADDFQIDFAALEAAFSEKTAALIVNSPNNPTGAILSAETLAALGDFLRGKEALYGKEIYLISDEPYREIVYDGCRAAFPADYYDDTIICYSYSKSLSLPGERIGYILVSPRAGSRADLFAAICGAGRSLGYVCAPSLLQRVVAENQGVCANFDVYKENRSLLLANLQAFGYSFIPPEGAFYLFLAAPDGDGNAFSEAAKKYELLLTPSDSFGMPGYVRLSYCISTEEVLRSLPAFRALAADYGILPEQQSHSKQSK